MKNIHTFEIKEEIFTTGVEVVMFNGGTLIIGLVEVSWLTEEETNLATLLPGFVTTVNLCPVPVTTKIKNSYFSYE